MFVFPRSLLRLSTITKLYSKRKPIRSDILVSFCHYNATSTNPSCQKLITNLMKLPLEFLRKSDIKNYDPNSLQRIDVSFDPRDGKPLPIKKMEKPLNIVDVKLNKNKDLYNIEWNDGHTSAFNVTWIETQIQRRRHYYKKQEVNNYNGSLQLENNDISCIIPRIPWSNMNEEAIRTQAQYQNMRFDFCDVVNENPERINKAVKSLYQYGIIFITSTPTDDNGAGVSALASALSGPANKLSPKSTILRYYLDCRKQQQCPSKTILEYGTDGPFRTMYGNVWYTNSTSMSDGLSVADSSYGNGALPLHTDFSYFREPPGLQIFTMVSPAEHGGESTYADGLAVAEYMRTHHEKEFDTLCRLKRRYRSIDEKNGWYLEASGPVIEAIDQWQGLSPSSMSDESFGSRWGPILAIRHNDLDRLPDLPPKVQNINHNQMNSQEEFDSIFYDDLEKAHQVWDSLLTRDEFRLVIKLKAGETVVVSNTRCLHGRYAFTTKIDSPRSIMGCYVGQDDVESRYRWMMNGNCTFN